MKPNTVWLSPLSTEQALKAAFAIPDPQAVVKKTQNEWKTPKRATAPKTKKKPRAQKG
ncbi:hypothetical protein LRP31_07940 [Mesorhizobium mediterraneum]|uniref:hypothetical protein n=1 Tax=Mesorhizobium mediterraneum TaxID=43617 RepID=UPI00130530C9|nr:hypothetical protein [Mesorhizobium mediterraneum]WIW55155.1 hypothetical protein LRP31_07940 [Mesorhizobium mediterraneum]